MSGPFLDIYLPTGVLSQQTTASPMFSTTIVRSDSGDEQRNRNRVHPMHFYRIPDAAKDHDVVEALRSHWMVTAGPLTSFAFRDPMDFASVGLQTVNVAPAVTALDQAIGTGDGFRKVFQITKTYASGGFSYTRPIRLPVVASLLVAVGGVVQPSGWTVARVGGSITFGTAPAAGLAITAGYLFDVPVRFASDDDFGSILHDFRVSGSADLMLVETTLCGV